ncbi:MAG: hypothetical protein CVT86_01495 [Alphaproteobacteria bacterium HGW-Alphaproteobacteria-8]|jgi:hypothetical protein|nr:MAG: hypothetical protein CVT86_01495 [Alphaproteobacteria bacterium HGW-Alphaproteobacteria-8]
MANIKMMKALEGLPDWPTLMTAPVAAAFLSLREPAFERGVAHGAFRRRRMGRFLILPRYRGSTAGSIWQCPQKGLTPKGPIQKPELCAKAGLPRLADVGGADFSPQTMRLGALAAAARLWMSGSGVAVSG